MAHVLTSWKEVAAHMGKGVRTVQRWEAELGLPVHRPQQTHTHTVLAFPEELDACGSPLRSREGVDCVRLDNLLLHHRDLMRQLAENLRTGRTLRVKIRRTEADIADLHNRLEQFSPKRHTKVQAHSAGAA